MRKWGTNESCVSCRIARYRKPEQLWTNSRTNRILYNITGKAICSVTRAPFDLPAYKLDQLYVPIYFSLKCRIFIYTFRYVSLTQRENTTSILNDDAVCYCCCEATNISALSFLASSAVLKFLIIFKTKLCNYYCYQKLYFVLRVAMFPRKPL